MKHFAMALACLTVAAMPVGVQAAASGSASMTTNFQVIDLDVTDGVISGFSIGPRPYLNVGAFSTPETSLPAQESTVFGALSSHSTDGLVSAWGSVSPDLLSVSASANGVSRFSVSASAGKGYVLGGYIELAPHTQVTISGVLNLFAWSSTDLLHPSTTDFALAIGGVWLEYDHFGQKMDITGANFTEVASALGYNGWYGHVEQSLSRSYEVVFANRSGNTAAQYISIGVGVSGDSVSLAVPEPEQWQLLGGGLLALAFAARARKRLG